MGRYRVNIRINVRPSTSLSLSLRSPRNPSCTTVMQTRQQHAFPAIFHITQLIAWSQAKQLVVPSVVGQDLFPPFITTGSPLFEHVDLSLSLSLAHPFSNITEQSAARASVARSAVRPPSPAVLTTKVTDPTFLSLHTHTHTHKSADLITQSVGSREVQHMLWLSCEARLTLRPALTRLRN
jgi:hypothetical protein